MKARILAYHRLTDDPVSGLETWSVSPAVFRRQMSLLAKLGYRGVSVPELLDALEVGESTRKLVGLTFDDGYRDTFEAGLPVLRDLGFTASVYIVPDAVGLESSWEGPGKAAPLASWQELGELTRAGWEVGLHSRSHPPRLDLLTGTGLEQELCAGIRRIREHLGADVETFAFPHGHYSAEALSVLEAAGYRAALTRDPGVVDAGTPRFELPRYEIKRRDTLVEFAFLMLTGITPRRRETLARLKPSGWFSPTSDTTIPMLPDDTDHPTRDAA